MTAFEGAFREMKYLIRYPEGFAPGKKYPVLLFLHGAGTRERFDILREHAIFKTVSAEVYPLAVCAPYCHRDSWFELFETLMDFVRFLQDEAWVDGRRVYLMGNSMGGYAAWQLGMSMPERFAAIVPICGGGMYWNAARLKDVPVWAFHGRNDTTVLPEESVRMVDAVNRAGGSARLTIYPDCAHDAWTPTFGDRNVFEWLLTQRK